MVLAVFFDPVGVVGVPGDEGSAGVAGGDLEVFVAVCGEFEEGFECDVGVLGGVHYFVTPVCFG